MSLLSLRLSGAFRFLAARPLWSVFAGLLLAGLLIAGYRGVFAGASWILDYPLIDSIAPAVLRRSLEGVFLVLMAAVLFSVMIASISTLFGSQDLEFLLSQPTGSAGVFSLKVAELFLNAAGLPLVFTLPVLLGLGSALEAAPSYYLVSILSAVALYALPVTLGALIALVLVRFSPAGRVREVAISVSICAAAVALLALRSLRPEQLLNLDLADAELFERFLTTFSNLDLGWLPPAWASNASWSALSGELHPSLFLLLGLGAAGLMLTGWLARVAYRRGWVRSLDSSPQGRTRPARITPAWWERSLLRHLGVIGAILVKDIRSFTRDVQQWSQLIVLLALAGVYFVSLSATPVPTQQFRDAVGAINIAFMGFIAAGVGVRIAYPAVSLEGGTWWLQQVQPVRTRDVVLAKFLLVLPVMLALSGTLGVAAVWLLDLSQLLATASLIAALAAAVALSGLAVGIGAALPRFAHTNPNELAVSPGAIMYMGFALLYAAAVTVLLARPAWRAINSQAGASYWLTGEGLLTLAVLVLLTVFATAAPLALGTRRLARYGT